MIEFEYTDKEKDCLREYTCRKDKVFFSSYRSKINEAAGINENSNRVINTFLGTGEFPDDVWNIDTLIDFMDRIETLFIVSCKYGLTHELPKIMYREENKEGIVNLDNTLISKQYVTDTFKSFSLKESEASIFKEGVISRLIELDSSKNYFVPFIKVNELIGGNSYYDDEEEILLPPFIILMKDEVIKNDNQKRYKVSNPSSYCNLNNNWYYLPYDQFGDLFNKSLNKEEKNKLLDKLFDTFLARCTIIFNFYENITFFSKKYFSSVSPSCEEINNILIEELNNYNLMNSSTKSR